MMQVLSFFLLLPIYFIKLFGFFISYFFKLIFFILRPIIGKVELQAPFWFGVAKKLLDNLSVYIKKHTLAIGISILFGIGGFFAYNYSQAWQDNQPKPIEIASVKETHTKAIYYIPENRNYYDGEKPQDKYFYIEFQDSVAPIEKKEIEGISISPKVKGKWSWEGDSKLKFTPEEYFALDTKYTIKIDDKKLFTPNTYLENKEFAFKTRAFSYNIAQQELYQNPTDPSDKNVIYQIAFSDPIDVQSFENSIKIELLEKMKKDIIEKDKKSVLERIQKNAKAYDFVVQYDEKKLNAWIKTTKVTLPQIESEMVLSFTNPLKANEYKSFDSSKKESRIFVPSSYTNIFKNTFLTLAEENDELKQSFVVELIDSIDIEELKKELKVWILPKNRPITSKYKEILKDYRWSNMDYIDNEILQNAQELKLTLNETVNKNESIISFKYDAEPNQYLFVSIGKNLQTVGGYKAKDAVKAVLKVPDFPKKLNFLSDGSLLSLKGDKKLPIISSNINGVKLELKRVIPSQIQHLVSMSHDWKFKNKKFNKITENHFIESFEIKKALQIGNPSKIQYNGIDISQYLHTKNGLNQGVFLAKIIEWDPKTDTLNYENTENRLFVVTDIGIISKKSGNSQDDIFVQSISKAEPISKAKVTVLGLNGIPISSGYTNEDGHIQFLNLDEKKQEEAATVYIVEKDGDMSFLPYSIYSSDRKLDFSRFDTSGVAYEKREGRLTAHLFSDREVYRPSELINIGTIVRAQNWSINPVNIPVIAKVYDARGQIFKTIPFKLDESGFNEISFQTTEDSATGFWQVNLEIADSYNDDENGNYKNTTLGNVTISIKEFEPDRMNVKLEIEPRNIKAWVKPDELNITAIANNLFGSPAQDRLVSSSITMTPAYFSFKDFDNFRFYDNRYLKNSFNTKLEDTRTNKDGKAKLNLLLEEYQNSSYKLDIMSEVFEAGGGRSVFANTSIVVSSNDYLIGAKSDGDLEYIKKDSVRNLEFVAINQNLEPIKVEDLTLELIEQKYISVLTKQDSGVYKYQSVLKEEVVLNDKISINKDKTKYKVDSSNPGTYTLLVKNGSGEVLYKTNYHIVGSANVDKKLDRDAELEMKLSKTTYKNEEEIEISITAPYIGHGLITIEKDRIYSSKWFKMDSTSSIQTIKVPKDLKGNGYVNVQFVRDINSDEIFMSPLSYSVLPFDVEITKEQAKINLESSKLVKPNEELEIKITTNNKQKVVVFAVDEGILQVANYKLEDPLKYFFRKQELAVSSYQTLDLILPEFSQIMKLTSAAGGDGEVNKKMMSPNPFKRKVDKAVAFWSGIVEVDGEKTFKYKVPDYFNGKLRIMAVAVSSDKIAIAQTSTTVRDDFVLNPNVPYMLAPNDEFEISLAVANNLEVLNDKKANIEVFLATSKGLELLSEAKQNINLASQEEGFVTFKLKATEVLGNADFNFKATYKDKDKIYSTSRVTTSSIRPLVQFRTLSKLKRMSSTKEEVENFRDLYEEFSSKDARVSHSPFIVANGLSSFLNNYPHNCSEQLTSRAFSALINDKYLEVMRAKPSNIQNDYLFSVLATRQNSQGSIGLWRASSYEDIFVSLYAAHYLIEARENGVDVPSSLLKNLNSYLSSYAQNSSNNSLDKLRYKAYASYLLTRQEIVTTNILSSIVNELEKDYKNSWKEDVIALYIASIYKILQMDKEAEMIIQAYWKNMQKAFDNAWWTNNYYDPLVVGASGIYYISKHFPEKVQDIPAQALENMVLMVRKNDYTTTGSSMSILALDSYTQALKNLAEEGKVELSIEAYKELKDGELAMKRLISQNDKFLAIGDFENNDKKLIFNNPSNLPTWYSVVEEGYDKTTPKEAIKKGLEVYKEYTNEKGEVVNSVKLGEKINVTIRIRSNSKEGINSIAVTDLLPGGFEVVYKDSLNQSEEDQDNEYFDSMISTEGTDWSIDYNDIREDRVLIYGYVSKNISTFKYQIKATNIGEYSIPSIHAEAMYEREIQSVSADQGKIKVTEK